MSGAQSPGDSKWREKLAQEIEEFVDYCKSIPHADGWNIEMVSVVLGSFGVWLRGKSEKEARTGDEPTRKDGDE